MYVCMCVYIYIYIYYIYKYMCFLFFNPDFLGRENLVVAVVVVTVYRSYEQCHLPG